MKKFTLMCLIALVSIPMLAQNTGGFRSVHSLGKTKEKISQNIAEIKGMMNGFYDISLQSLETIDNLTKGDFQKTLGSNTDGIKIEELQKAYAQFYPTNFIADFNRLNGEIIYNMNTIINQKNMIANMYNEYNKQLKDWSESNPFGSQKCLDQFNKGTDMAFEVMQEQLDLAEHRLNEYKAFHDEIKPKLDGLIEYYKKIIPNVEYNMKDNDIYPYQLIQQIYSKP